MSTLLSRRGSISKEAILEVDAIVRVRLDTPTGYDGTDETASDVCEIVGVDVATTANVALSGIQTIDGQAGSDGLRVWARSQTDAKQNQFYYMRAGAWEAIVTDISHSTVVRVATGSTLSGTRGVITNATTPIVGADSINWEFAIVGTGTANRVARFSGPGRVAASSLITDDGTRVQINSGDTSGLFNVSRSHASAAAAYIRNTSTGVAVLGQADGSTGVAVEGYAVGASGIGVFGHSGSGFGIWGLATSGTAGYFESDTGITISAYSNNSARTAPVAFIDQHHGSNATAVSLSVQQAGTAYAIDIGTNGGGINVASTGSTRVGRFSRGVSGATTEVALIEQTHASNNQVALKISNVSSGSSAGGIFCVATGGIGAFFQSTTNSASYDYRNSNTASAPTSVIWQDHGGDTNDVLYIRGDGSGNLLAVNDGGAGNIFVVEDGGVVNMRGAGVRKSTTTKSAAYTLTKSDYLIFCQTTTAAAGFAITLPAPAAGMEFALIDSQNNAGTKNVTLTRSGTERIDGAAANKVLNTNNFRIIIWSDGTDWFTK